MWATELLELLIHSTGVTSWVLAMILLLLVPGLVGGIINSYTHSRTDNLSAYITKFVPYPIFSLSVYVVNFLAACNIILQLGIRLWDWTDSNLPELGQMLLWSSIGLVGLGIFYRLSYSLWSYLYMSLEQSIWLKQDYFFIAALRAVLLLLMEIILLSPIDTIVYLWILAFSLGLIQILRWIQAVRRLWHGSLDHVYIFLYLCGHELLPWLCFAQLVWYWVEG